MTRHALNIVDENSSYAYDSDFDVILCCSGYEERARYLAKKIFKSKRSLAAKKFVISFKDFESAPQRQQNDLFFREHGYQDFCADYEIYGQISSRLAWLLSQFEGKVRILIDYSAMRRTMYSEIIQFMASHAEGHRFVATFSYSVGIPAGDQHPKVISDYLMLPGFEGNTNSQRAKCGVYILGFEPILLHSINEWIEPSDAVAFYASPGANAGSGARCLKLNRRFLDESQCPVFAQSLYSVRGFSRSFVELVKFITLNRDVIVYCGGPKPFNLATLLSTSSSCFPSHVYAQGSEARILDIKPIGKIINCTTYRV